MSEKTIGLINLDSGVYMFNETLRYISRKLRKSNYKVITLECGNSLRSCTCFNAINEIDIQRIGHDKVCLPENRIESNFNYVINSDIKCEEAENFKKFFYQRFNKNNKIKDVIDMKYKNFPIPRIAFFDFSLKEKISSEHKLNENLKTKYFDGVFDQITLINSLEEICKKLKLTKIIYINGNYSQNSLIRSFFKKKGIESLSIENQPTSQGILNKISIIKERAVVEPEFLYKKMNLKESKSKISILDTIKTLKNFGARIKGNDYNAYTSLHLNSNTKNELKALNKFSNKYSLIHSYFLSSEDEVLSHEVCYGIDKKGNKNRITNFPFISQEEFTEYFIKETFNSPNIGFIIRLHPRMAANKRNDFESDEHIRYKKLLSRIKIPANLFILYGDSNISSYYVVNLSNLVITTWSTIGLESLLLGKRAIILFPFRTCYPVGSFSSQPKDWSECRETIFKGNNLGIVDDICLISWVQNAFESQFFLTPVPRGKGGLLGKIYGKIYKIFSKLGIYFIISNTLDLLNYKSLKPDKNFLLLKKEKNYRFTKFKNFIFKKLIKNYRIKFQKLLLKYGEI